MHEYSLVRAMVDRVEQEARARAAPRRSPASRCAIGAMSGVEPRLFASAFTLCREGILAGAELDIRAVGGRLGLPARAPPRSRGRRAALRRPATSPAKLVDRGRDAPGADRDGGALMCDTCGCGDPNMVSVEVHDKILSVNDRTAAHNREHFAEGGVFAVNLMGSPGAGKTAVLEATARALAGTGRLGVIAGDLETERDADRLRAVGVPAAAITTGSACHLDAEMVHQSLHDFPWRELDYLFVENVGNLVCPAIYDLGPGRQRGGALRDRGRGQAAQVPGDVPQGRPGPAHEGGPAAAPRLPRGRGAGRARAGHAGARGPAGLRPDRRGSRRVAPLAGGSAVGPASGHSRARPPATTRTREVGRPGEGLHYARP